MLPTKSWFILNYCFEFGSNNENQCEQCQRVPTLVPTLAFVYIFFIIIDRGGYGGSFDGADEYGLSDMVTRSLRFGKCLLPQALS